ncbi:hypothetical protein KP509_25G062100 [Ceratopteris richardii]|uniref:non-specific serine/threonine protein kinase n=1 Tax=Ceratopteris richardii TaxID=49495 RepID=A0A8T2RSE7_CERRI|nr:hypothetical protein KP509_25G062100 [Ceratopteris richardii]KAH7298862.1 hypothetical protein KP509_25G062100 [Ceratopteris richardii]KAH7298863.1 hypothetical protein KP509_25G062100 [Ceratopteris richardii]KAH7298864.1 hypothetical protein KP509_25G062100 [Ceratopteris richardii]KAH7298865.1 hypothetical protein KP509_25G062100 [Ceratopteris richardii]
MAERKLRWQNQNHFLQARHGFDKESSSPETIAVALPPEDDRAFDLLCWTINMAARPGDSVVGLRQRDCDTMQKFIAGNGYKSQAIANHFKPLQELCNLKQVGLEMKCASIDVAEKLLVEEVSALNATMLVVTVSGHNLKRHAQRRANFLSRQLPLGCSAVVVKDYKILSYKENKFQSGSVNKGQGYAEEVASPRLHATLFPIRACQSPRQFDISAASSILSPKIGRMYSPKRVLDSSDVFYDSYGSPSSDNSALSYSLLRKPLMSCSSSSHWEEDSTSQPCSCLSIRRSKSQQFGTHFFLSGGRHKRFKAWRFHLKSFMNSLWLSWPSRGGRPSISVAAIGNSWKVLTYDDILRATNSFNKDNIVGKGGHSEVYRGVMVNGELVAVKTLMRCNVDEQRTIDFLTEIGMICHALHPNITPLVGYCIEKGLFLVYKFMEHGNLAAWLYGGGLPPLKWEIRYKVALGTARGLNYLHSGCQRRIIHRDIKASNILLGSDFEPQISDFGLAKWLPTEWSHHVLSPVEGTFGYLAPEYVMNGIVDEKTDVFAYGVLLLELITGREPIEGLQSSLLMWAKPHLENMDVEKLADPQLKGEYDPQEMQSMMMAAALCVQQLPQCRPCMGQVLQLLTDEQSLDGLDSFNARSSHSLLHDDFSYSSSCYQDEMRRHRELALQF